jgi:hypothetical protein
MQVVARANARVQPGQRRLLVVAIVVLLYASLTAVGVRHSWQGAGTGGQSAQGVTADLGSGPAGSGAASGPSDVGAVAGGGAGVGAAGGTGSTGNGTARPSAGGARTQPAAGVSAQTPVTATEIKIGVITSSQNNNSVVSAFGLKGEGIGDTQAEAKAVIDSINAGGGVAGRRIVPVFVSNDITSGTYSGQAQANCTSFTEDNKVFAVVGAGVEIPGLATCLAKHGVPIIPTPWVLGAIGLMDHPQMDSYAGFLKWPNQLDPDNYRGIIDRLVATGYFTASSRIGLMRSDTDATKRISDQVIKPALAAHGLKLTDEAASTPNDSVSGIGEPASQIASAVLKFRTDFVDRVMFLGGTSSGAFFFMPQAESQGYRPRYFLTSWDMPYFLSANVPKAQFNGAVAIGWETGVDVDAAHEPPPNPAKAQCLDLMHRAGQTITDPDVEAFMTGYCDAFQLLRAALAGANTVTPQALAAGVDRLGASFQPAQTFSVRFGPGRQAGVSSYRDLLFDGGCGCFVYGGSVDIG